MGVDRNIRVPPRRTVSRKGVKISGLRCGLRGKKQDRNVFFSENYLVHWGEVTGTKMSGMTVWPGKSA